MISRIRGMPRDGVPARKPHRSSNLPMKHITASPPDLGQRFVRRCESVGRVVTTNARVSMRGS